MMDALSKSCKDYDMRINKKKTKVMRVCRGTDKSVNITVDGIQIEQVHEFQYLDSVLSEDAYCSQEIKRRIAMGKAAFNQRKELMCMQRSKYGPKEENHESVGLVRSIVSMDLRLGP